MSKRMKVWFLCMGGVSALALTTDVLAQRGGGGRGGGGGGGGRSAGHAAPSAPKHANAGPAMTRPSGGAAQAHGNVGGKEGIRFTSFYAQPSCTAGRAAFITGQLPVRTGLTTVGTPGSPAGLQKEDITLAEILKTKGYSTAQFGKNHLGDPIFRDPPIAKPLNHVFTAYGRILYLLPKRRFSRVF